LIIEYAGGSSEEISEGGVSLVGGANIGFLLPDDDDTAVMEINPAVGTEDPYYRNKYKGLAGISEGSSAEGSSVAPNQPAWLFTDETLYVAAFNGVLSEPLSGAMFVVGDFCNNTGQFEVPDNPGLPEELGEGSSLPGGELSLFNICTPCYDCHSYQRIEEYLDRILSFYNYIFDLCYRSNTQDIPIHPEGVVKESFAGVHQQWMSSLRYWDNLLSKSTVKHSAQSFGQSIVSAGYYKNISDRLIGAVSDGITIRHTFIFQKVDSSGVVTDWDGISASITDITVLDREGRCSAPLGGSGITFVGSNEVQVETISGTKLVSGQEIFSDVAMVLLGTALDNDPNYTYQVVVELYVSHTHLGDVGSNNPITRSALVYFRPPDAEPST